MKKFLVWVMVAVTMMTLRITVFANNDIAVKIDGKKIAFDVEPQLINSRTMVPLRAIFEALGATVDWDDPTQTVTSTKATTTISLTINSPTMYVNGIAVTLDSPACLVNSRTLVPVRAISEAFNCGVDWEDKTSTVFISTNPELCKNGHTWLDATCTNPKTCVNCGRDDGESTGHKLGEFIVSKEPNCVECGIKSALCMICGETINEDIGTLEHVVGDWEVTRTETSVGKRTKKCTVCKSIVAEEEYTKSPEEIKSDYKWYCAPYDYKQLARAVDVNIGKKAHVKGCIMQVIENNDNFVFLVQITRTTYSWDDIIWVTYDRNNVDLHRFVENEIVDVYGELAGMYTYETRGGYQNMVPHIKAKYIDIGYVIAE